VVRQFIPVVVLLAVGVAHADPKRDARLARGEVIVKLVDVPGSDVPRAWAWGVVDEPPEKVWAVIEDCARYPGTMPNVESAKLLRRNGNHFICKVSIDLPFPIGDLWGVTDAVHTVGPPVWSRKWKHIEGTYSINEGGWKLTSFGADGKRTLVEYSVYAVPDTSIPNFVQRFAQEKSLPGLIEAIRKAAKRR